MIRLKELAAALQDRKDEKGFTLIELIIVIAIIGILVAIAVPVYGAIQSNARQKAVDSAAKEVATAVVAGISDDAGTNDQAEATAIAGKYNDDSGKIEVTATLDTVNSEVNTTSTYDGHSETGSATASY